MGDPTTQYRFSIITYIGDEVSSIETITQYTAPEAPTGASISVDSDVYTNAQLSWSAPSAGSVDSYLVSTRPDVEVTVDNESRTASIVGLVPGLTYSFTVTLVFQGIESVGESLTFELPVTTTTPVSTDVSTASTPAETTTAEPTTDETTTDEPGKFWQVQLRNTLR